MVPMNLVRAALGLLAVFFAHFLGRALVCLVQRRMAGARVAPWLIRFALAFGAILWSGGFDATAVVTLAASGLSGGYGAWRQWRPQLREDLTRQIFPEDPEDPRHRAR